MTTKISRAIIPAAGKGTRLMPLTRAVAKEMLPLGRKPILEHIVEEVVFCGITDILFVISEEKRSIPDYFQGIPGITISSVIQPEQKGLGDAVLWGEEFAQGEPFAIVLGDSVITTSDERIPLQRVLDTFETTSAAGAIIMQDTPPEEAHRYGMAKPKTDMQGKNPVEPFEMSDIIEKPQPEEIPSRYAVAGRYAFDARLFDYLKRTQPGAGGEIQLTDAVRLMLKDGLSIWSVPLKPGEIRRDIGTFPSYFEAFTIACALDPECGQMIKKVLEEIE